MNRQAQPNDIIEDGRFASDSEMVEVGATGADGFVAVDDVTNEVAALRLGRLSRSEAVWAVTYDALECSLADTHDDYCCLWYVVVVVGA